jgi:hypothetical protein
MNDVTIVPGQLTEAVPDRETDLQQISSLIAGDGEAPEIVDASGEDTPEAELPAPEPETETPDDDAPEAAKPEIDYEMAVPMPDGLEPVTLGALKDHYQATKDFDTQRDTWESKRMASDNQLIAAKRELEQLAAMMGGIKPEALQFVRQQRALNRDEQVAKLVEVIPEWADSTVKKAAAAELVSMVQDYGISEAEFAHIDNHQHLKILYDLNRLRKKEAAAIAKAEKLALEVPKHQKTPARQISKAQEQRNKIKRAQDGTQQDKLAAIGALIG